MTTASNSHFAKRYNALTKEKAGGAVYTPKVLSDFVAQQIAKNINWTVINGSLRILDPAVGHGELLISLLEHLSCQRKENIAVYGFEIDSDALHTARKRLKKRFPNVSFYFESSNFLEFANKSFEHNGHENRRYSSVPKSYDLIIANPPYVRTQVMGAMQAQLISERFGLSGRVDLYHAFILGMSLVLKPHGIAGIIVSNRFMTTKSGASIRQAIFDRFQMRHAWDLGDTKLFEAAVLPAVLLVEGKNSHKRRPSSFTSIYQTSDIANRTATDPITALNMKGVIKIDDGRHFNVQHGKLDTNGSPDGVWRIATKASDAWLKTVESYSWGTFRDIGKIRVGVKTCADSVFIRNDWQDMPKSKRPELLRLLTTHHVARRFRPQAPNKPKHILYPHEVVHGRRCAVDLASYPRTRAYFAAHRPALEGRKYVIEAGRKWYEIWVPQDPSIWDQPKLVFRDIAEKPTFWLDLDGSVVNGDCYWLVSKNGTDTSLLWLAAAVANSTFLEHFYDIRFHNKLYAGRRRFITQYVENFPLPDPNRDISRAIIAKAKQVYKRTPSSISDNLQKEINSMVWESLTGSSPE